MSDTQHFPVIIIGSGPAGLTAALYAARADLTPLVLEGPQAGGQLTITTEVENYPGFPEGILGPELMDRCREQCKRFGTEVRVETVKSVEIDERPFKLESEDLSGNAASYTCDALIVATGASAQLLGLPEEDRLMSQGGGVSACAVCDGALPAYRNKHLIVIGGGDSAMEEATYLTKFASKVTIVHRRDEFRASKIMADRALANDKIEVAWNSVVTEYLLDENKAFVTGVRLEDTQSGETREVECGGVFIAIGHKPNTDLFRDKLPMDDKGYLETHPDRTATDVEGVYVCGDAQDAYYRQAVTAAGTGCMAAMEAERFLSEQG
jgi:thioredoxin reductase (NADPH)